MDNLKKSNELLEAIVDGTAFDKETGLIWEHWVNAIIKQVDLNNIELRGSEESSHESAALPLHNVSVNEGQEFLRAGVAVCPHFDECINNGKNEHCDLQTFQEIDCFIGQTER